MAYCTGVSGDPRLLSTSNTLKSVLILEEDYQVDFNHQNSIAKVLGFTSVKYTREFHESENVVNIISINSILVNIDIISGNYVNGTTRNTIYSFFPKVSPGYKIIESPVNLVYLPITLDVIDSLEISITDQDDSSVYMGILGQPFYPIFANFSKPGPLFQIS